MEPQAVTEDVLGERTMPFSARRAVVVLVVGAVVCGVAAVAGHRFYVDPFSGLGQSLPLVVLGLLALLLLFLGLRVRSQGADTGAVLVGAWLSWFGATQLHGTPFPYGGMRADIARLTAAATKFSVHLESTDLLVKGLPTEYPPLFPWFVGRASAITGEPAWQLIGIGSVVFCGVGVIAGYLLWRRLVAPAMALALSVIPVAVYGDPRKAHEVVALCVLTPWVLAGLARYRRGTPPLHWAGAGVVGGLLVTDYQGYLVFSLVGIVVVVLLGLRHAGGRLTYLRHLALATLTALLTAGWFLGPWLVGLARLGGDDSADLFQPFEAKTDPWHLPWQHPWPVAVLLCTGTVLLVWHAVRHDWARYLLALALSAMGYRWLMLLRYERTGHTAFFHYTGRFYDGVLLIGLTLSLAALGPALAVRVPVLLRLTPHPRRIGAALSAVALVVTSLGCFWSANRAGHAEDPNTPNFTRLAHATELPGGGFPEFSSEAGQLTRFPALEVQRIVERHLGSGAVPTVLSYDESLSSYYPYYQYVGVGSSSANSLAHWPHREAEVWRLSAVHDPKAFAAASAEVDGGQIDVFVLKGVNRWFMWRGVRFDKAQFAEPYFHTDLAFSNTWVFTRVGAKVEHVDYPR